MSGVLAYLREKADAEKVVIVGALGSVIVAFAAKHGVVVEGLAVQEVLLPLATALIARVFATSKGVTPGL
jgi:hypothetical protein